LLAPAQQRSDPAAAHASWRCDAAWPAIEPPARHAGGAPPAGRRARSRAAAQPLLRPIIAICNDLYAPALRPLRTVARVVQFRPPAVRAPRCPGAVHLCVHIQVCANR